MYSRTWKYFGFEETTTCLTSSFGLNTKSIPAYRVVDGSYLGLYSDPHAIQIGDGKEDWPRAMEHFIASLVQVSRDGKSLPADSCSMACVK